MKCSSCQKEVQQDWIYCYYCGTKLRESNIDENYTRILAMYEYELTRRQALESKSATYIGLTSVMVTVLLVVGNLLFRSGDVLNHGFMFIILFFLYICAVVGFTLSAVFAFRAYHTGSIFMSYTVLTRLLGKILGKLVGKGVYKIVTPEIVNQFSEATPEDAKRELSKIYSETWMINYTLNNLKSDHILVSYGLSSISLAIIAVTTIVMLLLKM